MQAEAAPVEEAPLGVTNTLPLWGKRMLKTVQQPLLCDHLSLPQTPALSQKLPAAQAPPPPLSATMNWKLSLHWQRTYYRLPPASVRVSGAARLESALLVEVGKGRDYRPFYPFHPWVARLLVAHPGMCTVEAVVVVAVVVVLVVAVVGAPVVVRGGVLSFPSPQ